MIGEGKMTRMCIYDDDIEFSLLFEKLLYRYAEENDKEIDVEIFQGGENAAFQIAQNEYDILFLDIDLGDVKGFEIGKQIRDELKNNKIQIVYISGDTSYAMELFNTRPFDFVVKPVEKKKLFKMLDTYFSIFSGKNKYLHYRWLKQDHIIKQDNIIYLQSIGRKVVQRHLMVMLNFMINYLKLLINLMIINFAVCINLLLSIQFMLMYLRVIRL